MDAQLSSRRIRAGLATFAVGAALAGAGQILHPAEPLPAREVATFAVISAGTQSRVAHALFVVAGVLLLFGAFALYGLLASSRAERPALIGLVGSVLGWSVLLVVSGAIVIVTPMVSQRLVDGTAEMGPLLIDLFAILIPLIGVGLVLAITGAIAFAVAVWRSDLLPRWSAVPYAVGLTVLEGAEQGPLGVRIVAGVFLAVAAGGLALAAWRRAGGAAIRVRAEGGPHVTPAR